MDKCICWIIHLIIQSQYWTTFQPNIDIEEDTLVQNYKSSCEASMTVFIFLDFCLQSWMTEEVWHVLLPYSPVLQGHPNWRQTPAGPRRTTGRKLPGFLCLTGNLSDRWQSSSQTPQTTSLWMEPSGLRVQVRRPRLRQRHQHLSLFQRRLWTPLDQVSWKDYAH